MVLMIFVTMKIISHCFHLTLLIFCGMILAGAGKLLLSDLIVLRILVLLAVLLVMVALAFPWNIHLSTMAEMMGREIRKFGTVVLKQLKK